MLLKDSILAGLIATAAMTLVVELISLVLHKPYHVIAILSRMLHFRQNANNNKFAFFVLATIVHFAIGIIFALAYEWLLRRGILQNDLKNALLYGVCLGVVAIAGWRLFFKIHPCPPAIGLKGYLSLIFVGHIVLAFTLAEFFFNGGSRLLSQTL